MMKVFVLLGALCAVVADGHAADPPNIVILLADDLGYGELGCQGNPEIPTPHIDSIANRGVRCTQAYVTAPNCSPSRAGLLTGRIPTRFGYEFNPIGAKNEDPTAGLPRSERTLSQLLHDGGYTTGLIGKWHLGGTAEYNPQRRGFDEFFGFLHEGHFFVPPPYRGVTTMLRRRALPGGDQGRWTSDRLIYTTHMGHDEPPYDADNPIYRGGQPVVEDQYLTDAFTREAVDFIDRHSDKPFLLYLAYNAVHSPLQGADAYMERFAPIENIHRRIFAAMLSNLDDSVGAILNKLHREELDAQTLIFFLSDNGGPTRELTSSNLPLRGEKGSMYEGGIRVPFLVRWQGRLPAGQVYDKPVTSLDILPTALSAAGLSVPRHSDGVNLTPYLTEEASDRPHNVFYWRQGHKTAVRVGDWKLVRMSNRQDPWELYNLADDLEEANDRAATEPARLKELQGVWEQLDGEMVEAAF